MKICPACNFENSDQVDICEKCQHPLSDSEKEIDNSVFEDSDFNEVESENSKTEESKDPLDMLDHSPILIEKGKKPSFYSLKNGSKFDEIYTIVKTVSKSLMGNRYIVKDQEDGEHFILRVIPKSFYRSKEKLFKPLKDYQQHQQTRDFQIYEYGEKEDYYYIITSYIDGRTLTQIMQSKLERGDKFRLKHAYGLIAQVAGQLRSLHPKYYHSFITPDSILITKNGEVILVDFGIFKDLTPAMRFRASISDSYTDFIAPELNFFDQKNLHLSDIYSMGILLYWLLTGRTPQEDFKLPKIPNDDMTRALQFFLEECFAPDPEKRFKNIHTFLQTLNTLLRGDLSPIVKKWGDEKVVDKEGDTGVPPKTPPKAPPKPPQFKKPPKFKPKSVKDKKLSIPISKKINEFDTFKNRKGDVTLGELDDVERWFFEKEGIDYGPVSAKTIRELVEDGELQPESTIKTLTHPIEKGEIRSFKLFENFLKDWNLRKGEEQFEKEVEKSKRNKRLIVIFMIAAVALIGAYVIYTKMTETPKNKYVHKSLDEMNKNKTVITGEDEDQDNNEENGDNKNIKKVKKGDKKRGKRGKRRYRKRKVIKNGKEVVVKEEILDEKDMKKVFDQNRTENKDVAAINFNKKGKKGKDLSNEIILKEVNKYKGAIIKCFEKEYERTGYLPPKLTVHYNVRTDGKIYNVLLNHPKYRKKRGKLNYCVIKVFRKVSFEPFAGGTKSGSFPLEFQIE